jgi:modulator of FtsH protease
MNGWENFFIAEVGASTTLTGLIFVRVSINLSKILAVPKLPNRALEALVIFLTGLVVSSLMLVPEQPLALMGSEIVVIGLITWISIIINDITVWKSATVDNRRKRLFRSR